MLWISCLRCVSLRLPSVWPCCVGVGQLWQRCFLGPAGEGPRGLDSSPGLWPQPPGQAVQVPAEWGGCCQVFRENSLSLVSRCLCSKPSVLLGVCMGGGCPVAACLRKRRTRNSLATGCHSDVPGDSCRLSACHPAPQLLRGCWQSRCTHRVCQRRGLRLPWPLSY